MNAGILPPSLKRTNVSWARLGQLFIVILCMVLITIFWSSEYVSTNYSVRHLVIDGSEPLAKDLYETTNLTFNISNFERTTANGRTCSNLTYTRERHVFEDNDCYPPAFFFPADVAVISSKVLQNSGMDHLIGKHGLINPNKKRPADTWRTEPAVLKLFNYATIHRQGVRTYIFGSNVWTGVERCHGPKPPTQPINVPLPKTHYRRAVLASSDDYGMAIYHSIVEKAFLLGIARKLLASDTDTVVLVDYTDGLQQGFIDLFGISRKRIRVIQKGESVKVDELFVPYFAECYYTSPVLLQLTRKWIWDNRPQFYTKNKEIENGHIVVLDRRDNGVCSRCLWNHAELLKALEVAFLNRKIISYHAGGGPTVMDTLKLFSQTELVVAPHGAGLLNMIFLPTNGKVLEIMNHELVYVFRDMAINLGLLYRCVGPYARGVEKADNFQADIVRTVEVAREMLSTDTSIKAFD